MGAGTTFPEVSGKMMKSVELAIPEQTLCAEFDFFAGPILKQQEALERENRELAAFRDALLPKLMSGEIDVSQVDLTQINSQFPKAWLSRRLSRCWDWICHSELAMRVVAPVFVGGREAFQFHRGFG